MESSENSQPLGSFWNYSSQETFNSKQNSSAEEQKENLKNVLQEGILRERTLNIESSSHQDLPDSQISDDLKSLNLNFSSQKTSKAANPFSSPKGNFQDFSQKDSLHKRLFFSCWAKSGMSGERAHNNPMKFVIKDLDSVRNLNLNSSSMAQMSRKWDSNALNEFDKSQLALIGKREYSYQERKEKLKDLIAKELESFVRAGKLGQGGFGEVELIFHKETKKFYAMKKLPKQNEPFDREDAEREYLALKKLIEYDDSDLLQVRNVFYTPGESLIVIMEYGRGTLRNLLDFLKDMRNQSNSSVWKEKDLHILYQQLLNQVRKLAKIGLIHGDIRFDNIIIRDDGSFVLSDYGLAYPMKNYTQEQLDIALKHGAINDDIQQITQIIEGVIQLEKLEIQPEKIFKLADLSLVNQRISFYEGIKDRYKIGQFKYPFKDIETAYENILKFIIYFNTKEILKYLQAEFESTPPEEHRKLQAFYFFFGDILLREGYIQQASLCFQESERELKAIGNEINKTRAADLYRKLALIHRDLSHFGPTNRYLQISMHYYTLALHSKQTTLQQTLQQDQVEELQKQIREHQRQIARTFSWLASLHLGHGNLAEAENFYREAIRILYLLEQEETNEQKEAHSRDFYFMNLYHAVGTCCRQRGQFKKALELTKISIPKYRKEAGLIHPLTGLAVYFLGRIYQQLSDFDIALRCYQISKGIFLNSFHHKHQYYANTLIHMAAICYLKGEKIKALVYYGQSLVIMRNTDLQLPYEFYLKYMIAVILIDLKICFKTAQGFLEWFMTEFRRENPQNQSIIAEFWINVEFTSKINHDFTLAIKIYHQRMKLIDENPCECPCLSLVLLQIARNHIVHKNKSQYKITSQLLEEVLTKMEKRMFAYFPSQFETCLYYLGHIYYEQEMYQKSHYYFQKCLKIRRLLYRKEPISGPNGEDCLVFLCQLEVCFHNKKLLLTIIRMNF